MVRIIRLAILFGMVFLVSCGPANKPTPAKAALPALEGAWTIKMTHSGGIMGLLRVVEVKDDGSYIVTDDRASTTKQGILSNEQLSGLIETYSTAQYMPVNGPEQFVCADCFIYSLEISGNGSNFNVELNDISLPDSGLEFLVDELRQITDAVLK